MKIMKTTNVEWHTIFPIFYISECKYTKNSGVIRLDRGLPCLKIPLEALIFLMDFRRCSGPNISPLNHWFAHKSIITLGPYKGSMHSKRYIHIIYDNKWNIIAIQRTDEDSNQSMYNSRVVHL